MIRDEPPGAIAARRHALGQHGGRVVERDEPGGGEILGVDPGHERSVRRERPRGGGEGVVEGDPLGGQPRHVGRRGTRVAVQAEIPRPDRVEDDVQDVGRPVRRSGKRAPGRVVAPGTHATHADSGERQQRSDGPTSAPGEPWPAASRIACGLGRPYADSDGHQKRGDRVDAREQEGDREGRGRRVQEDDRRLWDPTWAKGGEERERDG